MEAELKDALAGLKAGLEAKTDEKLNSLMETLAKKADIPVTEEEVKAMTTTLDRVEGS